MHVYSVTYILLIKDTYSVSLISKNIEQVFHCDRCFSRHMNRVLLNQALASNLEWESKEQLFKEDSRLNLHIIWSLSWSDKDWCLEIRAQVVASVKVRSMGHMIGFHDKDTGVIQFKSYLCLNQVSNNDITVQK